MDLTNLTYLYLDTNGPSFMSPGLCRVLNHHPTLKQALIVMGLLERNRPPISSKAYANYPKKESYRATFDCDDNAPPHQFVTQIVDSHFSDHSLVAVNKCWLQEESYAYTNVKPHAQILVDVAQKHSFQPNMVTTFPLGRPILAELAYDASFSLDTSHLFVPYNRDNEYFDEMSQMQEFQGWT